MIKILQINGADVNLVATDGSTVIENYNETLDSAVIIVPHLSSKIDIKPFYNVKFIYGDKTRYMCVDSYTCKEDNLDAETKTYTYEIHLFSETKKLERVVLPSMAITPRKTDTKLSVYDYLQRYLDEYCPKHIEPNTIGYKLTAKQFDFEITSSETTTDDFYGETTAHIYLGSEQSINAYSFVGELETDNGSTVLTKTLQATSSGVYITVTTSAECVVVGTVSVVISEDTLDTTNMLVNDYELSGEAQEKFSLDCPEVQWTNPTLRDVLNDLMLFNDCIATMENNVIKWIDLTVKRNQVANYNYIQESQTSDEYETDIRMELQNVMQTKISGIDNTVKTIERIPFTTSNYLITSENIYLETKYPIINIVKMTMYIACMKTEDDTTANFYGYDITDFVRESQEYETLPVVYRSDLIADDISTDAKPYMLKYKNFNVYYTRLGNKIEGFNSTTKEWMDFFSEGVMTLNYLKGLAKAQAVEDGECASSVVINTSPNFAGINSYFSTFFEIEYETTQSCVFEAGKKLASGFKSTIIDNQTNSWADAYSVGKLEYQKANRIGNKVFMINQRLDAGVTPIQIGDYLDDKIVYQTQYQKYISHEEVNAYAIEGFILRNYFTGIQSKVRTWVNAKNEAFKRHDLKKYYCEFSKTKKTEVNDYDINNKASYFLSPLTQSGVKPDYAIITSSYTNNWYAEDLVTRMIGNSIVLTTGFNDNGYAGKYVDTENIASDTPILEGVWHYDHTLATWTGKPPAVKNTSFKRASETAGGIPLNVYKYTNNDFEASDFNIKFLESVISTTTGSAVDMFEEIFEYPKISPTKWDNEVLSVNFDIHKDNKEIPLFSTQYEFCTDTEDIDFTSNFVKYQKLISTLGTQEVVLMSDGEQQPFTIVNDGETSAKITTYVNHGTFYVNNEEVLTFTDTKVIYINLRRAR